MEEEDAEGGGRKSVEEEDRGRGSVAGGWRKRECSRRCLLLSVGAFGRSDYTA